MRLSAIIAILLLAFAFVPAQAQSSFGVGFYEFENTVASMLYTGTWSSATAVSTVSGIGRTSSVVGSSVSWYAAGDTVVVWRLVRVSGITSKMDVCVNGTSCINVSNESVSTVNYWYPYVANVTPGSLITITLTSGVIWLDNLMVLSSASGSFPTPVPTATVLPSSTPASTTTPQPTPTPQPTATAYTLPGAMIMIDPARSYGDQNGRITATEYSATAADIHISNLLSLMFFSMWGMFLFAVFVLVRYKEKGKPK